MSTEIDGIGLQAGNLYASSSGGSLVNSQLFKDALNGVFKEMDQISYDFSDTEKPFVYNGKEIDKSGAGATFVLNQMLNRLEQQGTTIMNILQKSIELDKQLSSIVSK